MLSKAAFPHVHATPCTYAVVGSRQDSYLPSPPAHSFSTNNTLHISSSHRTPPPLPCSLPLPPLSSRLQPSRAADRHPRLRGSRRQAAKPPPALPLSLTHTLSLPSLSPAGAPRCHPSLAGAARRLLSQPSRIARMSNPIQGHCTVPHFLMFSLLSNCHGF